MDAIRLLGSLMGNNAVSRGGRGGLLDSLLGKALGGGAGGVLGGSTGRGTLDTLGNVLGGALGGARGRRSSSGFGSQTLMSVLGGLAVAAVSKYARNKMGSGDAPPAQGDLIDIDPDEAIASTGYDEHEANSRAEILIRAMINAAKADGHVDPQEQQNILQRAEGLGHEESAFLRRELSAPLDVQGFIQSVPRGMEREVYAMSLMGIELDANAEAQYLRQLAQGLSLSADVCNDIHRELGAPEIFN